MPIEPLVFLCYGRPNKATAYAIARGLWRERVESYNYMAKPIEDRIAGEREYLVYVYAAGLFVAIASETGFFRFAVVQEILAAQRVGAMDPAIKRVFFVTSAMKDHMATLKSDLRPDVEIDLDTVRDPAAMVGKLMEIMPATFWAKCRRAWETNKALYPGAWGALEEGYRDAEPAHIAVSSEALLAFVIGERSRVESYLQEDIEQFADLSHRWSFVNCLAEVLDHAAPAQASVLRSVRFRGLNPDHILVPRDVAMKFYRADEEIGAGSAVLRGAARIVNCLEDGRCGDAFEIAVKFTWERTRSVLLTGVYGCADKLGEVETAERSLRAVGFGR